jgi:hypothetical protein
MVQPDIHRASLPADAPTREEDAASQLPVILMITMIAGEFAAHLLSR